MDASRGFSSKVTPPWMDICDATMAPGGAPVARSFPASLSYGQERPCHRLGHCQERVFSIAETRTMNNNDYPRRRMAFLCTLASLEALLLLCWPLTSAGDYSAKQNAPRVDEPIWMQASPSTRRQVLSAATQSFVPSLEMRENVDFLLTPALLVQEAMSADIVVTYPSE